MCLEPDELSPYLQNKRGKAYPLRHASAKERRNKKIPPWVNPSQLKIGVAHSWLRTLAITQLIIIHTTEGMQNGYMPGRDVLVRGIIGDSHDRQIHVHRNVAMVFHL